MKSTIIVLGALLTLSAFSAAASFRGLGLSPPTKEPLSIREGSVRKGRSGIGYFSTRRMVGGGYRGGK